MCLTRGMYTYIVQSGESVVESVVVTLSLNHLRLPGFWEIFDDENEVDR